MGRFSFITVRQEAEGRYFRRGTALNRVLMEAPYLARCSSDKTAAKVRPREYALQFPYMQVNRSGMVSWLIFDLDHPNASIWEDANLAPPNLIVRNRQSGHSHLYYAIEPVCTTEQGRTRPIEYMKAIYLEMAARLRADINYASGPVAKTPGHPWWATTELHPNVYSLGTLAEYVDLPARTRRGSSVAANHDANSRHCQLFEVLRHYAYSIVQQEKAAESYEHFVARLEAYCFNAMPRVLRDAGSSKGDLAWSSIKATVKSVARWTWNHYRGTRRCNKGVMNLDQDLPLAERQRRSAARTAELRQRTTESRVRAACRALQAKGEALLQSAVAKVAGLTRQTVAIYRHVFDEVLQAEEIAVLAPAQTKPRDVKFDVHQVAAARRASAESAETPGRPWLAGGWMPEPSS